MKEQGNRRLFYNLLTSGTMETLDRIERSRIIFTNAVTFAGVPILLFFSVNAFSKALNAIGSSTLITSALLMLNDYLARRFRRFVFFRYSTASLLFILFFYLGVTGGTEGSGILWVLSYPLMALFLLGIISGTIAAFLLWAAIAVSLVHPALNQAGFSLLYTLRFLGSYVTIFMFSISYQVTMESSQRALKKSGDDLAAEKEQTDSIMHHVEQGLFLLEEGLVIGKSYSRSLHDLLMIEEDLEGRSFSDIIHPHMAEIDYNAAMDYLDMYYRSDINPELLREVNPLTEIAFHDEETGWDKVLRFVFSQVLRADGKIDILVSAADITEEVRLQEQLRQEENTYARNMEQLFQIIHISPPLLREFLEQSHEVLDGINSMLKDDNRNPSEMLDYIYKQLHNVKGNATLLGLKSLSLQIHETESRIQEIRKDTVEWDHMLDITLALGTLKEVFSEIEDLVARIESFQLGGLAPREDAAPSDSPVPALHNLVKAEAREQGKKARLEVGEFQWDKLDRSLNRHIQDVAVQLIRNSLAHGIEMPDERVKQGKADEGVISLKGQFTPDGLSLVFRDDGAGLDPEKIRERLKSMDNPPVKDPDALSRSELIRLIFSTGFSTREEADLSSGRGVGMSVIKDKVQQAGGRMRLASKVGLYTEFCFDFPGVGPGIDSGMDAL